jgi:hypothetical protein
MVVVSVTGCRRPWMPPVPNLESDPAAVQQQMLDHLQAKYGTTFQVYTANWAGGLLSGNVTTFGVYPTGGIPQDNFEVVSDTSGAQLAFHDGYVGNLMNPVYADKVGDIVTALLPGALVQIFPLGQNKTFPDDMDGTTTFDQFKAYADQNMQITFMVYVRLADDLDEAAVSTLLPTLQGELKAVAEKGYVDLMAYQATDFDTQVVPFLDDPSQCFFGVAAPGFTQFELGTQWGE